jgi:cell wall-associated NlpC family hydrolase
MAENPLDTRSAAGPVSVAPGWAGRYVGIPFRADGADFSGCNCWGLVRLVLEREAGIVVPRHADLDASNLRGAARAFLAGTRQMSAEAPFLPVVGSPAAFDVALMTALDARARRLPSHCGIMVDAHHLLHVEAAHDAVIVSSDDPLVRNRIVGLFRHRDLLCRSR